MGMVSGLYKGRSEWRGVCYRSCWAPDRGKRLLVEVSCYWRYKNYPSWATVRFEIRTWLGLSTKWKVNEICIKGCKWDSKTL